MSPSTSESVRPSAPFHHLGGPIELELAWFGVRLASHRVQLLSESVVRWDAWGEAFAGVEAGLDHWTRRVASWDGPRTPTGSKDGQYRRDCLVAYLQAALAEAKDLEFAEAHRCLWLAGAELLAWAGQLGVELS